MARALLTGSGDRVTAVAGLLSARGVDVLTAESGTHLPPELGLVDHYIQLPTAVRPDGATLVGRVRSFLSEGLLGRFALVEELLPVLRGAATVVLVSGNTPAAALPDDQNSRLALLHVLAHAARAELSPYGVRVVVLSGSRSDNDLVRVALHGGRTTRPPAWSRNRRAPGCRTSSTRTGAPR